MGAQYETRFYNRTAWEGRPKKVIALYAKFITHPRSFPSTTRLETPCGNPGAPSSKAKYVRSPIVNKYREGKVKRTPLRGVK